MLSRIKPWWIIPKHFPKGLKCVSNLSISSKVKLIVWGHSAECTTPVVPFLNIFKSLISCLEKLQIYFESSQKNHKIKTLQFPWNCLTSKFTKMHQREKEVVVGSCFPRTLPTWKTFHSLSSHLHAELNLIHEFFHNMPHFYQAFKSEPGFQLTIWQHRHKVKKELDGLGEGINKRFPLFLQDHSIKFLYKITKCCIYIADFIIFLIYNAELIFSFFVFPVWL